MSWSVERIHWAGVRLLAETGVVFHAPEALDVFRRHGLPTEGDRVFISEERVLQAANAAPADFVLTGRAPQPDLHLGGGEAVLATASGCPYVLEDGGTRPGTLADLETAFKLGQLLPNVDMNGQSVEPLDLPMEQRYGHALFAGLTLSDKALEYPMARPEHLELSFRAAEIMFGATWDERVRLFGVANSFSPLQFSEEMGHAVVRLAERGQAVCVTPSAMAGMTAPSSLAGVLAVQNAETLAGLVLTQLVREGAPFVYGGTSSLASMATGDFLIGVPQYWTLAKATVELARFYGLPCRAGGALTDSHLPDYQAGLESALGLGAALQAGADYVLHAMGALGSFNVLSFEKLILDDELAGGLRAALRPIPTEDEDLALETVDRVARGGSFLLEEHTLMHCRDFERPTFLNRANLDAWRRRGGRDAPAAARARVEELLGSYSPPEMDAMVRRRLEACCLDPGGAR